MSKISTLFLLYTLLGGIIILSSCARNYSAEELVYIKDIQSNRARKDSIMQYSPNSPFNFKGKVEFHPLKYFDVDPDFVLTSKITEYNQKDTVTVFGTKGEERKSVRYGFLSLDYNGEKFELNIYESIYQDSLEYYSIWFTDGTTNNESYGVGRYINFDLNLDPDHIYSIDFNTAYNPYCAYSSDYSCAIPTKEDHIEVAIYAGEKKFHD